MNYLFSITPLILLSEKSVAYKIGYALGYFFAMAWPYLLGAITIYLIYFFLKRRNKAKAQ